LAESLVGDKSLSRTNFFARNPVMTPNEVLKEFETSRTVPVGAIRAALDAREEMLPVFLAEIDRALHTPWEELPHADSYSIIFYILGEWGDPRAYLPLARFLSLDENTLDALLGDTLTEASDRVMASVATDDLRPIFDILLDSNAYLFARVGMMSALLRIAIERPKRRADIESFIEEFHLRVEPDADPYLLADWAEAVAILGLKHLTPEAHQAIMKDTSKLLSYSIKEFEDDQLAAAEDPTDQWFLNDRARPTAINTIAEVSSWHGYSEEYLRSLEKELAEEENSRALWNEPDIAFNPYRGVGRNDPCPCGSGKKFKKCCLN
jgi:hypothetical protein